MMKRSVGDSTLTLTLLLAGALLCAQLFSVRAEEQGQTAAAPGFVLGQAADEVLASGIIGARVENAAKERIGDVNDLVFDANGRVVTAVIGVGGFAGLGEKNVAVSFDTLEKQKGADGSMVLVLNVSKEALADAPVYKPLDERSLTEKLQEWGRKAREKADEYGEKAREKAAEYSEKAKEAYQKAQEQSPEKGTEETK